MAVFKGQNLLEFSDRFKTDLDCKEYLSQIKDKSSYKCLKCDHVAYQRKADFSRQCNICNHRESATANTPAGASMIASASLQLVPSISKQE